MSNNFIGLGKCSSLFLFILGNAIFKCLRDCLFNFTAFDPDSKIGLFGFQPILSNHSLITNIYMYFSYIIFGLLFSYILSKKVIEKKKSMQIDKPKESKKLIYNDNINITNKRIIQIISASFIIVFHSDIIKMLYLFDISSFDLWPCDILFILLFMKRYFVTNIYKHQKFAIIFILTICLILLITSTFFPYCDDDKDLNSYETIEDLTPSFLFFIPILIGFLLTSCITAFGRVLSKMLMDKKFISPYVIIIMTGIIGFILNSILLIFTTNFKCKYTNDYNDNDYLSKLSDSFCRVEDNGTKYHGHINVYFSNLKNRLSGNVTTNSDSLENGTFLPRTQFFIEVFAIYPLYLIVSFLEFTCEIFTIYYLNPTYLLIRDNLYYGTSRIILILYKLYENGSYYEHITLLQFILLESAEIFSLIGYAIYLEIIELRFYGFDENLKRNIISRGDMDIINTLTDITIDSDDEDEEEDNKDKIIEMVSKD